MKNIILLFTIFILFGCSISQNRLPTEEEAKSLFSDSLPPEPTWEGNQSSNIMIYIDGSGSMAGFTKSNGHLTGRTTYCRFLNNLSSYLRGTGDTISYYRFGDDISQIENLRNAYTQTLFYSDSTTQIAELIGDISKLENQPKYILIITDGIQASPGSEGFNEIVTSISNWLSRGFNFEIFIFRSEFYGSVWSKGKKLGIYDSNLYGKRPFYIYVLSPTEEVGKQLISGLSTFDDTLYASARYINFTSELFKQPKVKFNVPFKTFTNENNCLGKYTTKTNLKHFRWRKQGLSGDLIVSIHCKPLEGFQLFPNNIRHYVKAIAYTSKDTIQTPNVYLNKIEKSDSNTLMCSFGFENQNRKECIIYHIELKPGFGTIQLQEWVDSISTPTDESLQYFNRTLYFKEFITSILLNKRFMNQTLADFHINIVGR